MPNLNALKESKRNWISISFKKILKFYTDGVVALWQKWQQISDPNAT